MQINSLKKKQKMNKQRINNPCVPFENKMAEVCTRATETDRTILSLVADVLTHRTWRVECWHRHNPETMFELAKVWSFGDDEKKGDIGIDAVLNQSKYDLDYLKQLKKKIFAAGMKVIARETNPKTLQKPLLHRCCLQESVRADLAWDRILSSLKLLQSANLEALREKLSNCPKAHVGSIADMFFPSNDIPRWFKQAAEVISECVYNEMHLIRKMDEAVIGLDSTNAYDTLVKQRRINATLMNRETNHVKAYNFLCDALSASSFSSSPGYAIVLDFFRENGLEVAKMEHFCKVLDVESRTVRRMVKVPKKGKTELLFECAKYLPKLPDESRNLEFREWITELMKEIRVTAIQRPKEYEALKKCFGRCVGSIHVEPDSASMCEGAWFMTEICVRDKY